MLCVRMYKEVLKLLVPWCPTHANLGVDHDLLLRLERQFGLRGITLLWFRSYPSGRSYCFWFAGAAWRTV